MNRFYIPCKLPLPTSTGGEYRAVQMGTTDQYWSVTLFAAKRKTVLQGTNQVLLPLQYSYISNPLAELNKVRESSLGDLVASI
ncbi:hypothetical protein D0T60_13960 [Bacteroides sp. 224]|nr:hypothetical protein [Bacteroides sp. 224]